MKDTIREIVELKGDLSPAIPVAGNSSEASTMKGGLASSRGDRQAEAANQEGTVNTEEVQHDLLKMSIGHDDVAAKTRQEYRDTSDEESLEDLDFCAGTALEEEVSLIDFVSQPLQAYPVLLNVQGHEIIWSLSWITTLYHFLEIHAA